MKQTKLWSNVNCSVQVVVYLVFTLFLNHPSIKFSSLELPSEFVFYQFISCSFVSLLFPSNEKNSFFFVTSCIGWKIGSLFERTQPRRTQFAFRRIFNDLYSLAVCAVGSADTKFNFIFISRAVAWPRVMPSRQRKREMPITCCREAHKRTHF